MKKVVLTGAMLMVASSCHLGENAAKEKFLNEDLCSVEYDYEDGLFKLKNPKNGKVAEVAIEVQRAGEQVTGVRLRQVGSDKVQQVDLQDPVEIAEEELLSQQEELEWLTAELSEAEGLAEKLESNIMELSESRYKLAKQDPLDTQYTEAEKKVMKKLMHNAIPRDLLLAAAKLSAAAQAAGKQLHKIAEKVTEGVNAGTEDIDAGVKKLYDSIEAIQAKTEAQEQAKIALHNAVAELNLATHGLPDTVVFGRSEDGKASIWVNMRDGDIWGVDIKMDDSGNVYSFNPLKANGARLSMESINQYFPDRASCSGSESGSIPIVTPTPTR